MNYKWILFLEILFRFNFVLTVIDLFSPAGELLESLEDFPMNFGPDIPQKGIKGHHIILNFNSSDICFKKPPSPPISNRTWFAVLTLNRTCLFEQVSNLVFSGYSLAIFLDTSINRTNSQSHQFSFIGVNSSIPCTRVDNFSYKVLSHFKALDVVTVIYGDDQGVDSLILVLLSTLCLSILFALIISLLAFGCFRLYKKKDSLLTRWRLIWFPVHIFNKGDNFESCVICLDEYLDGEKLRVLNCGHAYHKKCVDPWLVKSKQECPLCKRKAHLKLVSHTRKLGYSPLIGTDEEDLGEDEDLPHENFIESRNLILKQSHQFLPNVSIIDSIPHPLRQEITHYGAINQPAVTSKSTLSHSIETVNIQKASCSTHPNFSDCSELPRYKILKSFSVKHNDHSQAHKRTNPFYDNKHKLSHQNRGKQNYKKKCGIKENKSIKPSIPHKLQPSFDSKKAQFYIGSVADDDHLLKLSPKAKSNFSYSIEEQLFQDESSEENN